MKTILDISKWNELTTADYDKIAKDYEGVIMRIGYTGYGKPAKNKVVDELYEAHDAALRERGLLLGIYWYGTDESPQEAEVAAKKLLELAKGRSYPLGVFYDTEDTHYQDKMGKDLLTDTVIAFNNYIKKNSKYITGVYASTSWFSSKLHISKLKGEIIWEAHYSKNDGKKHKSYKHNPNLHQYTSNHMINGKRFDDNVVVKKWWTDEAADKPETKPEVKPAPALSAKFKVGDKVQIKDTATKYATGQNIPARYKAAAKYTDTVKQTRTGEVLFTNINSWLKDTDVQSANTSAPAPKPTPTPKPTHNIKVGDRVTYKGALYKDSNGKGKGASVNGTFTVKIVNNNSHGVHLDSLGWVRPADVKKISAKKTPIKVGDKVMVLNNVQYNGGRFGVYYKHYDVLEVNGDRVVIGIGKVVTAAINAQNLKKV